MALAYVMTRRERRNEADLRELYERPVPPNLGSKTGVGLSILQTAVKVSYFWRRNLFIRSFGSGEGWRRDYNVTNKVFLLIE